MKQQLQEITPLEALKLLAEAGKPIEGFVFWDEDENLSVQGQLSGSAFATYSFTCGVSRDGVSRFKHCARVIAPLISAGDAKAIQHCFPEAKYVAMDENGAAYAFSEKPKADNDRTMWLGAGDSYSAIPGFDNYAPDWRESLVCLDDVLSE